MGGGQTYSNKAFYYRTDKTCTTVEKNTAYKNTESLAKTIGATVVYDGHCMGTYNNNYATSDDIFGKDKYHQTDLGADIAATAIYVSIFNTMPVITANSFIHGAVSNVAKPSVGYSASANTTVLTKTQIARIKYIVGYVYGIK